MRRPQPQHEIEIGQRFRAWRESVGWTRAKLAVAIRETGEKLAAYEDGRAPLRMDVFAKCWALSRPNPQYIAESIGPVSFPESAFPALSMASSRERFSTYYAREVAPLFSTPEAKAVIAKEWVSNCMDSMMIGLAVGPLVTPNQIERLSRAIEQMEHVIGKGGFEAIRRALVTSVLHKPSAALNSASVIASDSLLEQLRLRLVRATEARGKKTALAKRLDVPQSTVTGWLKGEFAPSAENTLQILKYLDEEEGPQKQPAAVLVTPQRKTKASKALESKSSSGPPRK